MLEALLAKQREAPPPQSPVPVPVIIQPDKKEEEDVSLSPSLSTMEFDFEDDLPYIPKTALGNVKLTSVDTNKTAFDEEGVEKLRKKKGNGNG